MNNLKEITPVVEENIFNLNIESIRSAFPILKRKIHGKELVYLDNAATTHKPQSVISVLDDFYKNSNSNIHRGVHLLSQEATDAFEKTRTVVKNFINAQHEHEIIFTRGVTEGINLLAHSFGEKYIKEGDEIIISHMEHHSNIVPWQMLCERKKAVLKIIPINNNGEIEIDEFKKLLNEKTKLVSVVHISNSLGTINPIEEIIKYSHSFNVPVIIDGAQAIHHTPVDVQKLDCDFYLFSGHKIYGPTGTGVLYGKTKYLEALPPFFGGGDMISSVTFEKTTYNVLPHKFEAGTPNIAGIIGLGEAIKYVQSIGFNFILKHEEELLIYATKKLNELDNIKIIGNAEKKSGVVSFIMKDIHPHDIGTILDTEGIAIRTGHHCTQPVMKRFNVPATARASFAVYNKKEEVDLLIYGLKKVTEVFG